MLRLYVRRTATTLSPDPPLSGSCRLSFRPKRGPASRLSHRSEATYPPAGTSPQPVPYLRPYQIQKKHHPKQRLHRKRPPMRPGKQKHVPHRQ